LSRVEAVQKVTGKLKFTSDMQLPGMLYGAILRSTKPHAILKSIDTSEALKLEGVKAIVTFADVPDTRYNPIFNAPYPEAGLLPKDKSIMRKEVCYVGEPIAAVAATSQELAEEATERIHVDYQNLPYVTDPVEALKPGAPKVRTELKSNVAEAWDAKGGNPMSIRYGNIDEGFRLADEIFEDEYRTQRQNQVPLEAHCAIAHWDEKGKLNIWSSTQSIFLLRERLSEALALPVSTIRVHNTYLGGSFGSKLQMSDVEPICALLAGKARKPVRLGLNRSEVFVTTSRHDMRLTIKTGVKKDGTITARYCKCVANTGAYATHGPSVAIVGGMYFDAAYNAPHRLFEAYATYTNTYSPGAMRGYGGAQCAFAIESQMTDIADKMGFDQIEFRLKNSFKLGDVNPRSGYTINSCGLEESARRAGEAFGWGKPIQQPLDPNRRRGRGVAFQTIRGSGTGTKSTVEKIIEHSGVTVKFNEDGKFIVLTAAIDMGCGQHTVYRNIAQETLGTDADMIDLETGNTDTTLFEGAIHASRGTYVVGSIIKSACEQLREQVLKAAGEMLNKNPESLKIQGKHLVSTQDPTVHLPLSELGLFARFHLNKSLVVSLAAEPPDNPPPFGAHFAEVDVDMLTGQVFVTRYVAAQDLGKAIYPAGAKGQVYGAIGQGIGQTLMEEVKFDERGRVLNSNLTDYKIPTVSDMPEAQVILVETNEPSGVGGKSISEASLHPVAPVIANAIKDAIGIRFRSLPISPAKVLAALNEGKTEYC
jgi:xanthine dehydrogenase molybdenum-binding subunit